MRKCDSVKSAASRQGRPCDNKESAQVRGTGKGVQMWHVMVTTCQTVQVPFDDDDESSSAERQRYVSSVQSIVVVNIAEADKIAIVMPRLGRNACSKSQSSGLRAKTGIRVPRLGPRTKVGILQTWNSQFRNTNHQTRQYRLLKSLSCSMMHLC